MAKVTIKDDGEKLLQEKDFDDIVCLVRRKNGEHVIFVAGRPDVTVALMAEATSKIVDSMKDDLHETIDNM